MKRKVARKAPRKEGLVIRSGKEGPLGKTQQQFNRLMKSLEKTRASHAKEQARLDDALVVSRTELMPLIEEINRTNRDLIAHGIQALKSMKLSAKRRDAFADLLSGKAADLLEDPMGLSEEDVAGLEAVIEELGPDHTRERSELEEAEEMAELCDMIEDVARAAGVELDLDDLEIKGDPEEFERQVRERLEKALNSADDSNISEPEIPRKQTKAQAAKERRRLELEQARTRDLKSLFKQLAKAFHPDLEPDPLLRQHKEKWMKRLNTAYASDDLREMLQLEMEWLGEEATNLATAGEEKLKVYCVVLKEQIEELKERTHFLLNEPQYGPLQRFRDPYYGTLANPATIKQVLEDELDRHFDMLRVLSGNNAASRRMVNDWADANARRSEDW